MSEGNVRIRPLRTLEELHTCEALQRQVWGFEDVSVVPHHLLLTVQMNGGVLLGAFTEEAERSRLVGFVFGFPGVQDRRLKHCSLMCGVLPERRFRGVGYRLKRAQREAVMNQGIDLVTWTFDPLQSLNAHFNFVKLGVLARQYERDIYGEMRDQLNRGLPTDRFVAEWWVGSARVEQRMGRLATEGDRGESPRADDQGVPPVNRTRRDPQSGLLCNEEIDLGRTEERLLVEIPRHIDRIKENDPELASRWREESRAIFESYFEKGYVATEFLSRDGRSPGVGDRGGRGCYLLAKVPVEALLEGKGSG